jgi:hypothetical protein
VVGRREEVAVRGPDRGALNLSSVMKKIFSYEEAVALIPQVRQITTEAVEELEGLPQADAEDSASIEGSLDYQRIVSSWADSILNLGIEVKGLWLIDFDNGSGYYCWRHPESSLQYFHGYDEGFTGRVKLN